MSGRRRLILLLALLAAPLACGDDGEGGGARVAGGPRPHMPTPTAKEPNAIPTIGPRTPTPTPGFGPEAGTIFVETDPLAVSAGVGGAVTVRAFVFDARNEPMNGVNLLFDWSPKIGVLRPISTITRSKELIPGGCAPIELAPGGCRRPTAETCRQPAPATCEQGVAETLLEIPPGITNPGTVTVIAMALGGRVGEARFSVVSGTVQRPVDMVLLRTNTSTCGTDSGGSVRLQAFVLGSDKKPMIGVNVLFLSPVGDVVPLIATTSAAPGPEQGQAQSTLNLVPGTPVLHDSSGNIAPYTITARTAGVAGSAQLFVVPGRACTEGAPSRPVGEPATIQIAISSNRIRARGDGEREASTIIASVRDSNGNRLNDAQVRFAIAPETVGSGALLLPTSLTPIGGCAPSNQGICGSDNDCQPPDFCVRSPVDRFTALTDRAGNAQVQLRSGPEIGPVVVQAEVPSKLGEPFTESCAHPREPGERCIVATASAVTVTAGPPDHLDIFMNVVGLTMPAGNLFSTVTAIVVDAHGYIVEDGTRVAFDLVPFSGQCSESPGRPCGSDADCPVAGVCQNPDRSSPRVGIVKFAFTNNPAPCDLRPFAVLSGRPVLPEPSAAITCVTYPPELRSTSIRVRARTNNGVEFTKVLTLPTVAGLPARHISTWTEPRAVQVGDDRDASVLVRAEVTGEAGIPVRYAELTFVATALPGGEHLAGAFAVPTSLTNSNGLAAAILDIPAGTTDSSIRVTVFGAGQSLPAGVTTDVVVNAEEPMVGEALDIELALASPNTIGLRGSPLPSTASLEFLVTDRAGAPLPAVPVEFFVTGVTGEHVAPRDTVTDDRGIARTSVSAGTRARPVRVAVGVDGDGDGLLDWVEEFQPVTVIGGPPSQERFSLMSEYVNLAGRVTTLLSNKIEAFLSGPFGNGVVGTPVSFVSNGASIVYVVEPFTDVNGNGIFDRGEPFVDFNGNGRRDNDSGMTDRQGRATATLVTEGAVPANGIVTVLATTTGEEPFVDVNGSGAYDPGDTFTDVPEPFADFDHNGRFDDDGVEWFLDVNGDGIWNSAQTPGEWHREAVIWAWTSVTLSGPTVASLEPSEFTIDEGGRQDFLLYVGDAEGNPIVGGSEIRARLTGEGALLVGFPAGGITVGDAGTFGALVPGVNRFRFAVVDDRAGGRHPGTELQLTVEIVSPESSQGSGGNGSVSVMSVGQLLPRIPRSPTRTPTTTPTPAPTRTLRRTPVVRPTRPPRPSPTRTVPRETPLLEIGRASGLPGDEVQVDVRLEGFGEAVAGMQNDILFDPTLVDLDKASACRINPAVGNRLKECDDDLPRGACKSLQRNLADCPNAAGCPTSSNGLRRFRGIILSTANVNEIPDGILYTCTFKIPANAETGSRAVLRCAHSGISDPTGSALPVRCTDGSIEIRKGVKSRLATY